MKAIAQKSYGGVEVLETLEVPLPKLLSRDILIKVKAVAMNPVDVKIRENYGSTTNTVLPEPKILGYDGAGVVEDIGGDVKFYKKGDEVYFAGSRSRNGCHAEYVAVDERIVGKKPKTLTFEESASLPLTGLTAWEGLYESMHINKADEGKTILIMAGAGGVGSIAIQIAKRLLKLRVVATASNAESVQVAERFGADYVIDHTKNLGQELKKIGIDDVDYILETVALEKNIASHLETIKPRGIICSIVTPKNIDSSLLQNLFLKSATLTTELMFARPVLGYDMEKQKEILDSISDLVDQGVLEHRAFTVLPSLSLDDIREAHRLQASGKTRGKIVLTAKF